MCLIVTKNEARRRVLKKEIKIYKWVYSDNNHFISPAQHFRYEPNGIYKTELEKGEKLDGTNYDHISCDRKSYYEYTGEDGRNLRVYLQGFHGYISPERSQAGGYGGRDVLIECTVPAGAKYVKDRTGAIVVSEIKIPKEAWHEKI